MADTHKRIYGLDILRALAILFVLYNHAGETIKEHVSPYYHLLSLDGVSIFFVLSGFLIGQILIRILETTNFSRQELFQFWVRRWFRTMPNYYLMLILLLGAEFVVSHLTGKPVLNVTKHLFFLQNFNWPQPVFFAEAWSLCIEEWFYLLIPLFLFLSVRISKAPRKKIILFWIITIILSVTVYRTYRAYHLPDTDINTWDLNIRKLVTTRLDSIMYGVLGAYLVYYSHGWWDRHVRAKFIIGCIILICSHVLFVIFPENHFYRDYLVFIISPLATFLILPMLYSIKSGEGTVYKIVTFISTISYSLYIVNLSLVYGRIMKVVMLKYPANSAPLAIVYYLTFWILSGIAAYLLYRYFEQPMLNLRDRIGKKKKVQSFQPAEIHTNKA